MSEDEDANGRGDDHANKLMCCVLPKKRFGRKQRQQEPREEAEDGIVDHLLPCRRSSCVCLTLRAVDVQEPKVSTQVDYRNFFIPHMSDILSLSFYWGKIDRYEAEALLEAKPEGAFLLRDSAQDDFVFSVSFR